MLQRRRGSMNSMWMLLVGSLAAIGILIALLWIGRADQNAGGSTLVMYCAAGLRTPIEIIASDYEREYGVRVELQYGGSNTLLNQIQVNKFDKGDLYLAADDFYTDKAFELGLAQELLSIAHMRPVIVVPKGNPNDIRSIRDLMRDKIRVVLADPDQAAVGRATRKRLQETPMDGGNAWDKLKEHVTESGVFKPTVSDVANDVKLGTVEAGIVWDATVAMPKYREDLDAVPIAELDGEPNLVSVGVLSSSEQSISALRFARFLTSSDKGLPVFKKFGLRPIEGDSWAERPELNFYCGAVNRRVIEDIVLGFQDRENCTINTVYDGCGILTSRMETIDDQKPEAGFPDIYMACDTYYLDVVRDWFQDSREISSTEIVIAIPKGSTRVKKLADLVAPGVRVAVGEPTRCTIGALTRRLLAAEQLYEPLKEKQSLEGEVVVEKSSSALLVPDVATGHVDAAIAYYSDTLASRDSIEIIRIESTLNRAVQPFSIARTSRHKHLARRLLNRITSSPEVFEDAGFQFLEPAHKMESVSRE